MRNWSTGCAASRADAWGPTEKIEVAGRIRYPDAFVSCTRPEPNATIIPEPVVVFEILSPGTSRTDRIQKVQEYQATASIRRYVILEQDSVGATVFARGDNGWYGFALGEGDVLDLPEIGVSLTLADLYVDAGLEPASP